MIRTRDRKGDLRAEVESQLAIWIHQVGTPRLLARGTLLFLQGHPAREIVYVDQGWMALIRTEDNGEDVIVALHQGGALLAAGAALSDSPHPMTAKARTAVHIHSVAAAALERIVEDDRELRSALLRELGLETIAHAARCGALGCLDAREHLERVLFDLALMSPVRPARIPLGVGDLAGLLAVDVTHACRLLRVLKRDGVIDIGRGWIVVPDPTRLLRQIAS